MSMQTGFFVDTALFRYRSGYHEINAFLAVPSVPTPMPALLLAHDVYGLDNQMQDLVLRFAKDGYAVLAPDFFTTKNGPASRNGSLISGLTLRRQTPDTMAISDIKNGYKYLIEQDYIAPDRVAVVGFGFGGTIALLSAAETRELAAAVNFYGDIAYPDSLISRVKPNSPIDMIGLMRCPLLSIYGAPDREISSQEIRGLEQTLRTKNKTFELKVYPRVPNGFFSDSRLERSNPEVGRDAYARTLSFLDRYLKF